MTDVKVNVVPEFNCYSCMDFGMYEICHPSTDGLIGWRNCEVCPPRPPLWKRWYTLPYGGFSREVWIDSPIDKLKRTETEVPF